MAKFVVKRLLLSPSCFHCSSLTALQDLRQFSTHLINRYSEPLQKQETKRQHTQEKKHSDLEYILRCPLSKVEERKDNPLLSMVEGGITPSVSYIMRETQSELSKFYLERWKKKMISEVGEEGLKKYQEEIIRTGIQLHTTIEDYLSGVPESTLHIDDINMGHWKSLQKVLPSVNKLVAMEEMITHQQLCYKGKFDCLAIFGNTLCLIDWKTSKKVKSKIEDTFDNPLQVAAYIGAINNSSFLEKIQAEPITNGAIVIAYPDGTPANVHRMDLKVCEKYWKKWLQRLHLFWCSVRDEARQDK